jgi:hypothetical protein
MKDPMVKLLLTLNLMFLAASSSCAQTKQKAEGVPSGQPQVLWSYDTGG